MLDSEGRFCVVRTLLAAALFSVALLALMFATGNTFGQRCAKVYPDHTPEWLDCVSRLAKAGN